MTVDQNWRSSLNKQHEISAGYAKEIILASTSQTSNNMCILFSRVSYKYFSKLVFFSFPVQSGRQFPIISNQSALYFPSYADTTDFRSHT